MYISKKQTCKILACAMSAIFVSSFSGVASAEDEVTINQNNYNGGDIPSTISDSDESDHTVNVHNIQSEAGEINSAFAYGNTNNNVLNIRNVNASSAFFHGGYSLGSGTASGNVVNFYSGTAGHIHGAHTVSGDATNNTVNFFDGTVNGEVGAGYSQGGNVINNTLNIYGGKINSTVYGGNASYSGTSGDAIGNILNISGGTINGDVYGGWALNGYAKNNEINISGNPDLSNANLYAGKGKDDTAVSGNNLNIYTKDLKVKDIGGFENLNFYLPANIENGNTVLTINNPTGSISNNINVSSNGGSNLKTGDNITLITTPSPTGLTLGNYTSDGILSQGISLDYELNLSPIINGGVTTDFEAKVGNAIGGGLKPQTELLNTGVVETASTLDSGTDRLLEWLPPEGFDDINSIPTTAFDPFVGIGGSSYKVDTGNGTKLKSKNSGINFGMARYLKNRHGTFIFAPVTDYGYDHYESTLDDANRTAGRGDTKYFTAGFICRQVSTHGMYYETSLRYGRVRTNFLSDNFMVHGVPTTASYSASTPCYCGHVRIGWRDHVSPQNILDVYGVYSLNRVKGFDTTVSTGENYRFSAVKSGRLRVGARLTREVKEKQNFYSEIAYIHEFTGETQGEYMGMSTRKSGLKGNIGLIELGWQMKPSKNSMTMLDAGLACWLGDKKGVQFAVKLKRDF